MSQPLAVVGPAAGFWGGGRMCPAATGIGRAGDGGLCEEGVRDEVSMCSGFLRPPPAILRPAAGLSWWC